MAKIDRIIQQEINPFDRVTFYAGNFWQEEQSESLTVEGIHKEAIAQVTEMLEMVAADHQTRTLLLCGDPGSGKSYLLGRIKKLLNSRAFFAYIGPWVESDRIWRHILRHTVDSLMQVPESESEGQGKGNGEGKSEGKSEAKSESQLLLWLQSLSAFSDGSPMKKLLGKRNLFIRNLRSAYPVGIFNPNEFFGALYGLTDPELYPLACDWLRGDDLDERSLEILGVKRAIETETAARDTLANIGRISTAVKPIVICFDQIDPVAETPNGYRELQALFTANTTIHNERLHNFLIAISLITNTWRRNEQQVLEADKDRLDRIVSLGGISWDEAEALWAKRLYPLHRQAKPKPASAIYPLTRTVLEEKFPGGKTLPRDTLKLGRQLFQEHKVNLGLDKTKLEKTKEKTKSKQQTPVQIPRDTIQADPNAAFQLLWNDEFNKTERRIGKIRHVSGPEMMSMLREALEALEVQEIQPRLLPSQKYGNYSFSCELPGYKGKVGFVWSEETNMTNFFYVMKACAKTIDLGLCKTLHLIRAERFVTTTNKSYNLYRKLFGGKTHRHIIPDLESVHCLATYHQFVNAAVAGELVVGDRTPDLAELQSLIRSAGILQDCTLLQDLQVVAPGEKKSEAKSSKTQQKKQASNAKKITLSLIKLNGILARKILVQNVKAQAEDIDKSKINEVIQQLAEEGKIQLLGDEAQETQFVCLAPKS